MIAATAFARLMFFLIPSVSAQCVGLAACARDFVVLRFITDVLPPVFLSIAGGVTVLFVVWGGAQMIVNFGDESAITKGRQNVIQGIIGFAVVLVSQAVITFVANRSAGIEFSENPFLDLMQLGVNVILAVFNIVFVAVMVFAGFRMVIGRGEQDEFGKAKTTLTGAILGAVLVNTAYAFVKAVISIGL